MSIRRAALDAAPRRLLSRGSRFKPAVHAVEIDGLACVVKDVRGIPAWSRALARWLMGREQRILRALAGVEGVPQLLDPIDRDAFAVAVLPGEPLTREAFEAHPSALAEGLRRILRAMHARGVYHLDLRQRQNILVEGETVSIVDFGAAWMPSWASRWLLAGIFRWVDRQAVLKYVARHAPQDLSRDEARSVLRFLRLRRWWIFSPHNDAGEWQAAQDKLREDP
jgi:predicted Ser/Thr protein kinase